MDARGPLAVLSTGGSTALADAVAERLGVVRTASRDVWFACGEGKHTLDANVRGTDVYIVCQPFVPGSDRSVYDRFTMLLHAADSARCADADRVVAVLPYLPGGRQDKRKAHVREGVSTGLFARMLQEAGVSMVITVEPHNEAMIGCFDPRRCVFEAINPTRSFARWLEGEGLRRDVVGSTDVGGMERARHFAESLRCDIVALSKERDYSKTSTVSHTTVIGEVEGRSVLIVDDIVDTAGSMVRAVQALWERGATDIAIATVHPLMSGPAWERLTALEAEARERGLTLRIAGTDSVVHADAPDWYTCYELADLLARVIRSVNTRGSVRAVEAEQS